MIGFAGAAEKKKERQRAIYKTILNSFVIARLYF